MYAFRPINRVAKIVLPDDFELVDDLTDDIQQYITDIEPSNVVTTLSQVSGLSQIIFNTPTAYTKWFCCIVECYRKQLYVSWYK